MKSVILLSLLVAYATAFCPLSSNPSPSRPKCFSFFKWNLTFAQAEAFCADYGGHLASVTNAFEANLVSVLGQGKGVSSGFWLGANDISQPGQFGWLDGTKWTYTRWTTGQPSAKQQCLYAANADGTWASQDCSRSLPFACAADIVPPSRPPCESGWTWNQNTSACYRTIHDVRTWQDAESMCNAIGAHLASIHSDAENNFVNSLAAAGVTVDDYQQVWLGMQKNSKAMWQWNDGSAMDYYNWAPGQPDNWKGNENCVETYADVRKSGSATTQLMWNDLRCDDSERAAVCKKAANH